MSAQPCDPPDYSPDEDDTTASAKHFLDRDPHDSTSCKVCGDVNGYGVLHLSEPVEDPEPQEWHCRSCLHDRHTGACRISLSPTRDMPCNCQAGAA